MPDILPVKRKVSGYTLVEVMLALSVIAILLTITSPTLKILNYLNEERYIDYQIETGVYQLQIRLACSTIEEIKDDEIIYFYNEDEYNLKMVNNNLISKPGTLIYLLNVDNVEFNNEDGVIIMNFTKDDREFTYPIAYEK